MSADVEKHWGYGSGMVGCLFDSGPEYAGTDLDEAIEGALSIFMDELTEEEANNARTDLLRWGNHYFPVARQGELGAAVVEVFEWQGDLPEEE